MIKKDKIFELKIEDDDELSGIDSISLVDEPAIEVNWVAFKKEKEHEFHIPDNEDAIYLEKLLAIGHDEQELLDEGWEAVKIVSVKEDFATTPNIDSNEDSNVFRVRYKYSLNQGIQGPKVIPTTRDFCRELINKNYVWRAEEIENLTNDFGDSAQIWRGGYNCRHEWFKIYYQKTGDIINKSSINKNKVLINDFPIEQQTDWLQPNTVTSKTLNNPSPSTVRNLGLSKEKFADKPKVSIDYDGTLSTPAGEDLYKELIAQGNDVYIVTARNEMEGATVLQKAKELRIPQDKVIFTNGKDKSPILKSLGISKHYDNNPDVIAEIKKNAPEIEGVNFAYDVAGINGYIDPGFKPKKKKKEDMDFEYLKPSKFESYSDYPDSVKNNAKAVLKYVDENGWGSCGTDVGKQRANQLANGEPISLDTVKRMYSYLSRHEVDLQSSKGYEDGCGKLMYDSWGGKSALSWAQSKINQSEDMSKQYFAQDEEKHIVLGPAMIPDQKIFRKDSLGNPYYVFFSPDTIKMIAEKYMRNKYIDNNDTMHDGKAIKDIHVLESWIKEDTSDKSSKYGFSDLPVGTWFVSMKVNNPDVWSKIKAGELNGFSVSGFFEEVAAFTREEMFLYQMAEILKKY